MWTRLSCAKGQKAGVLFCLRLPYIKPPACPSPPGAGRYHVWEPPAPLPQQPTQNGEVAIHLNWLRPGLFRKAASRPIRSPEEHPTEEACGLQGSLSPGELFLLKALGCPPACHPAGDTTLRVASNPAAVLRARSGNASCPMACSL